MVYKKDTMHIGTANMDHADVRILLLLLESTGVRRIPLAEEFSTKILKQKLFQPKNDIL